MDFIGFILLLIYTSEIVASDSDVSDCSLVSVQCSLVDGFKIDIDPSCRAQKYPNIPEDYENVFVTNIDLDKEPEKVQTTIDNLPDACKFDSSGSLEFSFTTCGEMTASFEDGDTHTAFTVYLNYRTKLGDTFVSTIDQIPIECKLEHVKMVNNKGPTINLAETKEVFNDVIVGKVLQETFQLDLVIGIVVSGQFVALPDDIKVDVGEIVRIQMRHSEDSKYHFALRNCKASAGIGTTYLYEGSCPNEDSKFFNLEWIDFKSFDIAIFRILNNPSITFSCTIGAFPTEDDLPDSCETDRKRRRRDTEEDTDASDEDITVSATIQINPEPNKKSDDNSSSSYVTSLSAFVLALLIL